ncbi:signal transducer and activator of transcription 5A-like [Bolinopsis microptera]|uniref:signal transducer and activator of transcription 5A-like n=1 Tax=Bolinopsis microptera TaxID=2820187 RepID=UPI00307A0796
MALWQQLSTCNVSTIQELYGHSPISILVRHNLAEHIEVRPWSQYNVEDPSHQRDIQQEFAHFMMMLKFKISELRNSGDMERIIDTSQRLEEQYNILNNNFSTNPSEFIKKMQHLLSEEAKILRAADTPEMEVKPTIGDTWMGDLQGSLFSLSFKHVKELKARIDEQINTLDERADLKRLSQEEMHRKTASFQARMSEMNAAQRESFHQNRERCMRTLQGMHSQINEVVTRLLSLFDDITRKLKEAHDYILKEIDDWKEEQRRGMISGKQPPSLDYIERDACVLADALTGCASYYARLRDHLDDMAENRSLILQFHGVILNFIRALMFKCFIIEKQPPQVMKRDTRFSAGVRVIAGERWGFAIKQPSVKVNLVNAEQAQAILNHNNSDVRDVQVCGEVLNGDKVMDYSTSTKTVQFQFKNLVLKKLNRAADRRAAELVTEEKFGVYFQCSVDLPYKRATHLTPTPTSETPAWCFQPSLSPSQ